ncbi:hypothetical protein [Clostridium tetani]|uniref:hypothetical protein n=1 Tax=Clostridium tetani TaxID=1513 RepID=UPI0013E92542|nr:hypothetical protein [Clostridium tetani]
MENEKIFELIEKMYIDLKGSQEKMYIDLKGSQEKMYADLKEGQEKICTELKSEISEVKKTVIRIENDHGKKLEALFDGYKQNSEKLNRIEDEVAKHKEVII